MKASKGQDPCEEEKKEKNGIEAEQEETKKAMKEAEDSL